MLKKVWNRVISTVSALAMISCVSLPQTQAVHAAYEAYQEESAAGKTTDEENTADISYSENLAELTPTERNVTSFEYEDKDFTVKAEVNTDAAFSLDGSPLRADEVHLSVSVIDETDDRYEKIQQAAANDAQTLLLYDIDFRTEDGEKVDVSACDAEVSFYFHQPFTSCKSDEIQVVHFTEIPLDSEEEDEISFESTEIEITGTSFVNEKLTDLAFHADSFSVYGILFPECALVTNAETTEVSSEMQVFEETQKAVKAAGNETSTNSSKDTPEAVGVLVGENGDSSAAVNTIETFSLALDSGASLNNGNYVWTPTTSNEGHGFIYNLTLSVSGEKLAARTVEIRIPKQILKDEDGNFAGELQLPYPAEDEAYDQERVNFVYREDDETDEIIIYNVKEFQAGTLVIPFMYETSKKTWYYMDMEPSDPCVATVTLNSRDSNGNLVTPKKETEKIPVYIDTAVEIQSTKKSCSDDFDAWDDSWGLTKPSDADDYIYFIWTVNTSITNITQKYNFKITDTFNGLANVENDTKGEVIGYRKHGTGFYTAPNEDGSSPTDTDLTDGKRTDYVLTRYPKSALDDVNQKYELSNSVTATVIPADGKDESSSKEDTATYVYEKTIPEPPTYSPPGESYSIAKYGVYGDKKHVGNANQISSYALENLKNGKALPGLTYHIHASANAYVKTLADGATGTEEQDAIDGKFGQKSITYSLSDSEIFLNDSIDALSKADYTFTSLAYKINMWSAEYNKESKSFKKSRVANFRDEDVLTFYVMTDDNGEYVRAATYSLSDGAVWINDTYISSLTDSAVYFKEGVKGWKMETTNPYYTIEFDIYPQITLNSTGTVKTAIENSTRLAVKNKGTLDVVDSSDQTIVSRPASGTDYVAEAQRNSSITKNFVNAKNYTGLRCYKVNWATSINETYTDDSGTFPVRQESGVFYDLIPVGCRVDLSSIQVYADDTKLTEGEFTVDSLIENYKDSGRTLLTVRMNVPTEKNYRMTYTTVHLWEDILDYGRYVLNSVAYETGNEDIANGYPDNGGNISDSTLLEDLDPDSDAKRFLYSQATHTVNALIPFSSGITKKVASATDASFGDETIVYQDSDYVYSIRMENSSLTSSKDIIILDSLENFCQRRNGETAGKECDWRGSLVSFGLSNLKNKGIAPVVYLSRVENINLEDYSTQDKAYDFFHAKDSNGNPIWVKADDFGDYSKAKAFAVDLSRKTDGSNFVLGPNESFSFTVNMRSPKTVNSEDIILETYNNIYRSFTSIETKTDDNGETVTEESYKYTHYDFTTVIYRTVGTLHFKKIDSDTKESIQGIQFNLSGTSDYGTVVDKDIMTNSKGEIYLADLERGRYLLHETDSTRDYLSGADRIVTVDQNGNVTISPNDEMTADGTRLPVIENKPRVHGDLSFLKRDALSLNEPVLGAVFTLTGTSEYGNKIEKTATSNGYGVTFEDVELGTYTLTETFTPDNYIAAKPYTVVCDADGILSIRDLSLNTNGDYVITDMPRQSFRLRKVDAVNQADLQDAEFTLQSVRTDSGEVITKTVTSDMFGKVLFEGLDFGSYTLKETKAPKNHALDTREYMVQIQLVDNQPVVTIDGLEIKLFEGEEYFVFPNERQNNGIIRIIKKWVDDGETDRPEPVIHLSTKEPEVQHYKATINKEQFKSAFPNTATSIQRDVWSSFADIEALNATKIGIGTGVPGADDEKDVYIYSNGTDYYIWSEAETVFLPTSLKQQFSSYTALRTANFLGLNSSKVTDMTSMFNGCSSLETVNLTGCDVSNVTSMESMFQDCTSITELNLSSFGTANALTNTKNMFLRCSNIKRINLSNLKNTERSIDMQNMFTNCGMLETVSFCNQENSINPTTIYGLFYQCFALKALNLIGFNTSNTKNMASAFANCKSLTSLTLGDHFVLTNVETTYYMFAGCLVLNDINFSSFKDAPNLTTMQQMFYDCDALETIDLSNLKTSTLLTNMLRVFDRCDKLTTVRFGNQLDTSKVTTIQSMFYNCTNLTTIEFGSFSTDSIKNMNSAFRDCKSLVTLDFSNFSFNNVTTVDVGDLFLNDNKLYKIYVSEKWSNKKFTNDTNMFNGCSSIVGGNNTSYSALHKNKEYACIDTTGTPGYLTDIASKTDTNSLSLTQITAFFADVADTLKTTAADVKDTLMEGWMRLTGNDEAISGSGEATADTDETTDTDNITEYISTSDATWTKEGNTWICEFKVYDENALYYVWEDPVAGYNSDATISNPKVVNADGSITQLQTITNKQPTASEPELGSLTLTKKVTQNNAVVEEDITDFTFQITLEGEKIGGTQYFGATEFVNGVAVVTLKHGISLTISDIPAGTTYSVKETDVPYGYASKTTSPETGAIETGVTKAVEWENAVIVRDPGTFHVSKTVMLYQVTKNLDGTESDPKPIDLTEEEQNQEFTFKATLTKLGRSAEYTIKKGDVEQKFSSDTSGNATVTFTLKSGETADFVDIPIGATYQITETTVDNYTAAYALTDASTDAQGTIESPSDTTSATAIETLESGENVTVAFSNSKTITVEETINTIQAEIEKQWANDTPADRPASITVYLERGIKLFSDSDTLYNQETCGTATITADDNWKTVFTDLPEKDEQGRTYVYSVQEESVAGYDCKIPPGSRDDAGNLSFTITNTKQPTYDLSINKNVTGVFGDKAKQFEFTVTLTDHEGNPLNGFYTLKREDSEVQLLFDVNGKAKVGVSHGETIVIKKLPQGTRFTVSETDYSKDGYTTESGLEDAALKKGLTVDGVLNSDKTVKYRNSRDGILPTGIVSNVTPLVVLGVFSLGAMMMLKRRRQHALL